LNNLSGCISNETPSGKLTKVADEVAFLKSLKTDPGQIFVSAITGPATPYSVGPDTMGTQSVVHSCGQNSSEYADPSVRIQQWVQAFGTHGVVETICAASYAPSLMLIATELGKLLGPQCIPNNLVDADPASAGLQPECEVSDQYVNDQGSRIRSVLPACAMNGNSPPCWSLGADVNRCPGAFLILNVNRGTGPLPGGLTTSISCAECIAGVSFPGCP